MINTTPNQNTNTTNKNMESDKMTADHSKLLNQKIKETWPKLADDDVKLYMQNQEQFFIKLKSIHHVDKIEAQTKLSDIKKMLSESMTKNKGQ
jgi:hypothetical protein